MQKKSLFFCGLFLFFFAQNAEAQIFVNIGSTCADNCDGSSWEMAFNNLQEALSVAQANDEIWVAQGTYIPHSNDRSVAFAVPDSVRLYGGFIGSEVSLEERNPSSNPTILSGDLAQNDGAGFFNSEENSYTIILTMNVSPATIVDGFTIAGGNANAETGPLEFRSGGGWFNFILWGTDGESSPTVRNCIFENNFAHQEGGGFYNGGNNGESYTTFLNCQFNFNQALIGGGIYNGGNLGICNPKIISCKFLNNHAVQTGGGIYNFALNGGTVNPQIANSIFKDNSANSAAGYYSLAIGGSSDSFITNCNFYGNNATNGGAIYLNSAADALCEATVINSIFWASTSAFDPHFHFSGTGSPKLSLSYSIVDAPDCQSLIDGEKPLVCESSTLFFNQDPLFVDAQNNDFHLKKSSPARNAGNNAAFETIEIEVDMDGEQRIQDELVDIGADEYKLIDVPVDTSRKFIETDGYKKFGLTLYPNPVVDGELNIFLSSKSNTNQQRDYMITDLRGRILQRGQILLNTYQNKIQLNPSTFDKYGIYLLKLVGLKTSFPFVLAP